MHGFWAFPLRRQLVLAILLVVLPVVGATLWSGVVTYRERVADLEEESLIVAAATATWLNRDLLAIDHDAAVLTASAPVQALDPAEAPALLRRALAARPGTDDILLVTVDGHLVARGAEAGGTSLPDAGAWFESTVQTGSRAIVPLPGDPDQPIRILVAHPVSGAGGRIVGALGQLVSLEPFHTAVAALPLPEGSVVTIRDDRGRTIAGGLEAGRYPAADPPPDHPPAVGPPAVAQPPQQREGADGVRRMYAEAMAEQGPWLISAGLPMSVATGRALSFWTRSFAVLGVVLTGWLIMALILSRRLGDAVGHLEAAARRAARGDYGPMQQTPRLSREFAALQAAFDAMLQRLNDTRRALDSQMAEERRMRQELQSLQGQVIRQERLAAVGQLVAGVAHEINNPLQAILGFAELLQLQANVPDEAKADLQIIQKESARACNIIRSLALFARQQPGEARPVRLTPVIQAVTELRRRRLESERIHLTIDDRSRQHVRAVSAELQQVVLNFVINAEQAILSSGRLPGLITIRTFDRDHLVMLEIEDTGPGVPPEHEAKLFQPFFTTKPVGQGTGLGLSVSYGILESLGGRIGYRQAAAGGAIFYFELPSCEAPVVHASVFGMET